MWDFHTATVKLFLMLGGNYLLFVRVQRIQSMRYLRVLVPLELPFLRVRLRLRIVTLCAIIIYLVTVTDDISAFTVLLIDNFFA